MFFVTRRATLLIPSGPDHDPDRLHLHVVLNNPEKPSREVLLVCVTSANVGAAPDPACLISAGEHKFVSHDSCVAYRFAAIVSADAIEQRVKEGLFKPHQIVSTELFERIVDGVFSSKFIAPKFRHFLRGYLDDTD